MISRIVPRTADHPGARMGGYHRRRASHHQALRRRAEWTASIRDSFRLIRTGKLPTYEKSLLSRTPGRVRAFAEAQGELGSLTPIPENRSAPVGPAPTTLPGKWLGD
jgi:hypothetical protein